MACMGGLGTPEPYIYTLHGGGDPCIGFEGPRFRGPYIGSKGALYRFRGHMQSPDALGSEGVAASHKKSRAEHVQITCR
jgi:hypothetical protein